MGIILTQGTKLRALEACLRHWIGLESARIAEEHACQEATGFRITRSMKRAAADLVRRMAREAKPHLPALTRSNVHLSSTELAEIAAKLSPGGAHTGALLGRIIHENTCWVDKLLLAAIIYHNWHGGKVGFQYLPDPSITDLQTYYEEASSLLETISIGCDDDPRRILLDDDLLFFDSLPDTFTVYRGCDGILAEQAALGICWTLSRDVAEWFATRLNADAPILLTARVKKAAVVLAKATEFEVAVQVTSARAIKCRRRKSSGWRPEMSWGTGEALTTEPVIVSKARMRKAKGQDWK